jgi:acyl-CoA thioester hydrolase
MTQQFNWLFPNAFTKQIDVKPEDTDRLGHTNNVSYLRWLEAIAWEHMEYLKCGWQVNERLGKAMAITRTEMDYHSASYADESLILGTCITQSDYRVTSERVFQLFRLSDSKLLLSAKMQFACIDLKSGRASKMPIELIDAHKKAISLAT